MQNVILTVSKLENGNYEAANGRYNFTSKKDEELDHFRLRVSKHFFHCKIPKAVWFSYEK